MMMNYVLKPSLEHIALIKVAALLWNQRDIRDLIANFSLPSDYSKLLKAWEEIEENVVKKVAELPFPQLLKKKILNIINPIGFKILKWMVFLYQVCEIKVHLPNEFHWTAKGTIDEMKTAEVFIKDESMDIDTRYKLSCIYCSQNDILKLWKEMPENYKKTFYCEDPMQVKQNELVVFWTYVINGELAKLDQMIRKAVGHKSAYQYAFEFSANSGNRVAAEYFLQKLSPVARKESLINATVTALFEVINLTDIRYKNLKEHYCDVSVALLLQMEEEQQLKLFETRSDLVLRCLLEWPFQTFFIETANRTWNLFSEEDFGYYILCISEKMLFGYKDYDYKELFKRFWEQSPNYYKRFQLGCKSRMFLEALSNFFKFGDLDIIKFLYRDATVKEKQGIFYHDSAMYLCSDLIRDKEWDLLKFFITECLSTKGMMIKAKKDFENRLLWRFRYRGPSAIKEEKWQKFHTILNDLICGFSKRKCVYNSNDSTKKRFNELKKYRMYE